MRFLYSNLSNWKSLRRAVWGYKTIRLKKMYFWLLFPPKLIHPSKWTSSEFRYIKIPPRDNSYLSDMDHCSQVYVKSQFEYLYQDVFRWNMGYWESIKLSLMKSNLFRILLMLSWSIDKSWVVWSGPGFLSTSPALSNSKSNITVKKLLQKIMCKRISRHTQHRFKSLMIL